MDLGFAGARAAVTGGTKGMGRAIALRMAGEGAQVAVLARHQAEFDETVGALRAAGAPDAMGWATDVTDPSSVTAAFDAIGARWGSLNVLVNTVGPGAAKFEDLADDDWDAVFEIGLMSAVRSTRAALPLLRAAEWARIVNISAHSIQRQSPLARGVHRIEGGAVQRVEEPGQIAGPGRHPGQHREPRIHRHRQLQRGPPADVRGREPRPDRPVRRHEAGSTPTSISRPIWAGPGSPTRSPWWSSSWPRRPTATSPGPM